MHNSDSAFTKRRPMENDERSNPPRPPLPSSFSMPLSLYSGETSPATAGNSKVVRRMTRTRSSPTPLGHDFSEEDEDRRDSHDLSISPRAFGRESLVDNLLLSFDKFGNGDLGFDSAFFGPSGELDDDDAATTSSQKTGYSTRGRRSNSSSNYHSHLGRLPTHSSGGSRAFGSVDYGTVPAGYGLNYGRETFSRSGTSSSTMNGFVNSEYDPAPTPTVHSGPRDRSVTLESATKIERRGSIKSTRSSRKLQDHHAEEKMTLPPIPAFHSPAPAPVTPVKQSKAPGFFRRVFGGGSSSSSNNNSSKSKPLQQQSQQQQHHSETTEQKVVHSPQQQDVSTDPIPPATINKKPSFFRRRKKSMSDVNSQPAVPPQPVQPTRDEYQYDQPEPSPIVSHSTVINPYLRTPAIPAALDLELDHESPLSQHNATIRTVQASEPGSPPQRPTYFGESRARRDSETHFVPSPSPGLSKTARYSKESKFGKGHAPELTLDMPTPIKKSHKEDRPQTSPNSLLSLTVSPTEDLIWPPSLLAVRKSVDNMALEQEKQREIETTSNGRRPSQIAHEKPIATIKDIELQYAQLEQKRRESRGTGPLNLDVNVGAFADPNRHGSSWLATPTPLSAGSSMTTPTVMLQVEAGGDNVDSESEPADLGELLGADEATENEKLFVKKIFDGDEEFITKERAAAWLGTSTPASERARRAYLAMFDFSNMNILSAVRMLCGRLVLKGETQQVDRIVDAFSKRWCECNPNHGFKSADVVHTILYSLLLLNTDLHMVDVPSSQKMTRGQFLKNTMATIRRGLADVPGTPLEARPAHHTLPNRSSTLLTAHDSPVTSSGTFPLVREKTVEPRSSLDFGRSNRNSSKPGGIGNLSPRLPDDNSMDYDMDGGLALVNAPISGGIRLWETQVEIVLKDFYNSVKATALPLHGASKDKVNDTHSHSASALSVFGSGMLRRSPSTISKAGSERLGCDNTNRLNTKWASKNRSRPKIYNGSYAGSSRTSLEDRSLWSPSASSTWSKYSLDKTQTSMSVTSLGSVFGHPDYQQSIGFANALSHAIIREEASGTTADEASSAHLEDDGLELAGAPWAKEGMIKHKHHLEGVEKKAKNRMWTECFAVITKGNLKMFLFNTGKSAHNTGGVVGGGNWTENAQPIGTFLLRHTIASALPAPGYSKSRPHVWALSLPNGAVHFFQAGTAEIVKEWVSTANYWSARLSKEPLIGGVSNVEYGWGDCIADIDTSSTTATFGPRPSLQESIRSSIDHGSMVRPRLPGDKIVIAEWTPPGQSMMASPLNEADQLKALETYVANIDLDLSRHQDLRSAMTLAFSPRHPNHAKALANWERKSSYLLREIVKFRTYIDSLTTATTLREKIKEEERNRETMSVMTD